jgi:hypothetical protein
LLLWRGVLDRLCLGYFRLAAASARRVTGSCPRPLPATAVEMLAGWPEPVSEALSLLSLVAQ